MQILEQVAFISPDMNETLDLIQGLYMLDREDVTPLELAFTRKMTEYAAAFQTIRKLAVSLCDLKGNMADALSEGSTGSGDSEIFLHP